MFDIFGAIAGVSNAISGISNVLNTLTAKIADAKIAQINAKTAEEKIAADERVRTLELQRDTMLKAMETRANLQTAELGVSKANIYTRTMLALPIGIVLWKVFVWDKALGQWTGGHTDALSPELWQVIMVVLGFYFLYEGAVGVTRLIRGR